MFNWREDATFFLYKSAEKEIYYQKRNGIVDISGKFGDGSYDPFIRA